MADENTPWNGPQNSEPVTLPTIPKLEGLQPFRWDDQTPNQAPPETAQPQPATSEIPVPTEVTQPQIPTPEVASPASPDSGQNQVVTSSENSGFNAREFLNSLPVKTNTQETSQSPASAPITDIPVEAGAQSLIGQEQAQTPPNSEPVISVEQVAPSPQAESLEPSPVVETISSVAMNTPETAGPTVAPIEPVRVASPDPELPIQDIPTNTTSEIPSSHSTKINWGEKFPDRNPLPNNIAPESPRKAAVIPFPAQAVSETAADLTKAASDGAIDLTLQAGEQHREPTPIPTKTMGEYLNQNPSGSEKNHTDQISITSENKAPHAEKVVDFEAYRAEKIQRIKQAREVELLKIAYHKDAAARAERADKALLGQERYMESIDPESFAAVDNALNGEIPDIDTLSIHDLDQAA